MSDADGIAFHWASEGSPPPPEAFHVERIVDPFTFQEVVGMVRHEGWPYCVRRADSTLTLEAQCCNIAMDYLDALQRVLVLPAEQWIHPDIRAALREARKPDQRSFGFLPIAWPSAGNEAMRQRLSSFWADRSNGEDNVAMPRLMVLLAGSVYTERQLQSGTDMGLRIVVHVHADEVRIHGVTLVGLTSRRALEAVPAEREQDKDIFGLVNRVRDAVGLALDCHRDVWVNNLENACRPDTPPHHLIATGYALRKPKTDEVDPAIAQQETTRARTFDFRVELAVNPRGSVEMVQIHRDVYIGAGAVTRTLHCFVQDAQSNDSPGPPELTGSLAERRPTLGDDELGKFRVGVDAALARDGTLQFSDAGVDLFEIQAVGGIGTRRLGGSTVASNPSGVVIAGAATSADEVPPVRSDRQAAVDAHLRAVELFGRMLAYGIDPVAYFRFARLPLVQRPRPAMRWAPDGELPDAEVRPFLGELGADGRVSKPSDPLQLLVNYGSADPVHRHKLPLAEVANGNKLLPERLKAQYLSVASDPRWAWHEFGHILNFASTGELEFPFAHSAGDALAAIVADPISRLAAGADPDSRLRHVTYPWIEVPGRSHGRSAIRGYGWCGCRNLSRLDFTASLERYHHTYFGEQLMSSSLFRLYRSLGGDTRDPDRGSEEDELVRLSASDYCIYLIMRGISLLGPDTLAPARTADQFVSALIEADLGTGAWVVNATWPFNREARKLCRQGGRVHKVVRWAFEQQGLYAAPGPRDTAEGTGLPPAVDVYVADRRRDDGGDGDGGYAPVPLRHGDDERWHAHGGWLRRKGRTLKVKVANRGEKPAVETGLRIWTTARTTVENMTWTAVDAAVDRKDIDGADNVDFELQLPVEAEPGTLWVLVSVDAPADPSNLAAGPPPSSWPELLELVAHDNNLALARL